MTTQQELTASPREATRELSMRRVVAELQLLLAARRSARIAQQLEAATPGRKEELAA